MERNVTVWQAIFFFFFPFLISENSGTQIHTEALIHSGKTKAQCLTRCPCDAEFIVIECVAMKLDCIVCLWLIIPDGIAPHSAWHDAPGEKYGSGEAS